VKLPLGGASTPGNCTSDAVLESLSDVGERDREGLPVLQEPDIAAPTAPDFTCGGDGTRVIFAAIGIRPELEVPDKGIWGHWKAVPPTRTGLTDRMSLGVTGLGLGAAGEACLEVSLPGEIDRGKNTPPADKRSLEELCVGQLFLAGRPFTLCSREVVADILRAGGTEPIKGEGSGDARLITS